MRAQGGRRSYRHRATESPVPRRDAVEPAAAGNRIGIKAMDGFPASARKVADA